MLHLALKAFYPGQAAVPAAARRHDLEVPGDDRVPRPAWRASSGLDLIVHINQEGVGAGHQPVRPRLGDAHRRHEDRGAQAGARQVRLRRRVRRRPPRRGEVARQGARLLVPRPRSTAGTRRTSGRSSGTSTTRASDQGERSASSRSRTGPSSTSGSTSTSRTSRSCRSTSPRSGPVVERDGTLIMVDDDRMPLAARREAGDEARCASARSAATRSPARSRATPTTLPEIIQEMLLARTSERQGRVIDHDETASMEKKKRRATSDGATST